MASQPDSGSQQDEQESFSDTETSSTASVTNSARNYRRENGRTYHAFRDGGTLPHYEQHAKDSLIAYTDR